MADVAEAMKNIFLIGRQENSKNSDMVWENDESVGLIWHDPHSGEKIYRKFGKRAKYYYDCPNGSKCLLKSMRRVFIDRLVCCEGDRLDFFDSGETVVIEEDKSKISFYSGLGRIWGVKNNNAQAQIEDSEIAKLKLSFCINKGKDGEVECGRACAGARRVSYLTSSDDGSRDFPLVLPDCM